MLFRGLWDSCLKVWGGAGGSGGGVRHKGCRSDLKKGVDVWACVLGAGDGALDRRMMG